MAQVAINLGEKGQEIVFPQLHTYPASQETANSLGITTWAINGDSGGIVIAGIGGPQKEVLSLDILDLRHVNSQIIATLTPAISTIVLTYEEERVKTRARVPESVKLRLESANRDLQVRPSVRITAEECTWNLVQCVLGLIAASVATEIPTSLEGKFIVNTALVGAIAHCWKSVAIDCHPDKISLFPTPITMEFLEFCNKNPGDPTCTEVCNIWDENFSDEPGMLTPSFCGGAAPKPTPPPIPEMPEFCWDYPAHSDCVDYCQTIGLAIFDAGVDMDFPSFCHSTNNTNDEDEPGSATASGKKKQCYFPDEIDFLEMLPMEPVHGGAKICKTVWSEDSVHEGGTITITAHKAVECW